MQGQEALDAGTHAEGEAEHHDRSEIEVSATAIKDERVRIGIEAPLSIPIVRQELYLEPQRDQVAQAEAE